MPEYIVVHDGSPRDTTAQNYYVKYRDYIKNVASSEIYATWPEASIRANVLAIMSFTLNRVYTEWSRDQYRFMVSPSASPPAIIFFAAEYLYRVKLTSYFLAIP